MKKLSKALKNYVVDGIVLIVLGLILTIWSKYSLLALFKQVGIALIVMDAIKGILFFLKKDKKDRSVLELIVGVLQIAVGIVLIVKAGTLTGFFPVVAAVILGYGAVVMILHALKLKDGEKKTFTASLVLGIVSLVLAAVVFAHPAVLLGVMTQAAGVAMIFEGAALLFVLSRKV